MAIVVVIAADVESAESWRLMRGAIELARVALLADVAVVWTVVIRLVGCALFAIDDGITEQIVAAQLDPLRWRVLEVLLGSHVIALRLGLGELVQAFRGAAADLDAGPEPFGTHDASARVVEGRHVDVDEGLRAHGQLAGWCDIARAVRCYAYEIVAAAGAAGGGEARDGLDLLVVDDDVRAQWVVEVADGLAAVLDSHLFHVLGLLLGEAVEGDVQ